MEAAALHMGPLVPGTVDVVNVSVNVDNLHSVLHEYGEEVILEGVGDGFKPFHRRFQMVSFAMTTCLFL